MPIASADAGPTALYERVKRHILQRIRGGEWTSGMRLPSENELVRTLGVSRMTIHRALRELSAQGLLSRVQGVGTFVAAPQTRSELLEVRDITDDVVSRGHRHEARIVVLEAVRASADMASVFELRPGAKIFHSIVVHNEDGVPVQLEERHVAPAFAPAFLEQDFSKIAPAKYLLGIGQPTEVDHVVFAMLPDKRAQKLLKIDAEEPCLVITRRTWVTGVPVTRSTFTYPGSRYSLGSRYKVSEEGGRHLFSR